LAIGAGAEDDGDVGVVVEVAGEGEAVAGGEVDGRVEDLHEGAVPGGGLVEELVAGADLEAAEVLVAVGGEDDHVQREGGRAGGGDGGVAAGGDVDVVEETVEDVDGVVDLGGGAGEDVEDAGHGHGRVGE